MRELLKILIVDDDRNLHRTLADIFASKGYQPVVTGTGQEALEIANRETLAVALIDLRLEDMPGLEVLRLLREQHDDIACIVLTGHASQSSAIEAINLGAYSYVQKPFDVDQLLLTIRRAIEKGEAEQALLQSNQQLEATLTELREAQQRVIGQERLAAVGQLAAGLAHEYNNMMATIILYSDIMLRTSVLNDVDRDRIAAIHEQGRRATELTQQILDFSRRAILRKQRVMAQDFLRGVKLQLQRVLPERVHVTTVCESEPLFLEIDVERLRQAVSNLALNARDAMPEGGSLTIGVAPLMVTDDKASPHPDLNPGEWVVLSLTDSGTGIAPEVLPHIFEPFFTTRAPLGSGLGLSQVYGIVRQHDGTIDVATKVGEGTTFKLYLPAYPASGDARRPGESNVDEHEEHQLSTLVIEEHELVREALAAALDSLGYPSREVSATQEALAIPVRQAQRVNLILSDISSSASDDASLVHDLRRHFPSARIVLIGDQIPDQNVFRMIRAGTIRWLQKPVDLVKLAEVLADTSSRHVAPDAAQMRGMSGSAS